MADSDAVRSRRKRAHQRDDHRWCREGCQDRGTSARIPVDDVDLEGNDDPRAGLLASARRLEAACRERPADASLAKVLMSTWVAIADIDSGAGDSTEALLRDLSA